MSDEPLLLAVPSKGRLQENAFAFFAQAGLPLMQPRGSRDYRGTVAGLPSARVLFLSASEIAKELSLGNVHLGVTGEDLIREQVPQADTRVLLLAPLGFGPASVVIAVPQAWIDVRTMADLDDVATRFRSRLGRPLRVATKYITLTRSFFAQNGLGDYRIVESLGATEGAPASGTADVIVDITTTGSTLAANALKVLDDGLILKSEANLVASLRADWNPTALSAARAILARLGAAARARAVQEVKALPKGDRAMIVKLAGEQFGAVAPFGISADGPLVLHVPKSAIYPIADWLMAQGADTVATTDLDDVFQSTNPLNERLLAALGPR
ncbi:ATP phosphoribosyltransferase [Flaviflagellibacter deserti]|jgi:ATP phosphoribosyltransferase|uniref:ATP phosphoribosyltransferase n=1 Tax=Flaviflagellibacter deserti TaxID=2267266 RepID=A0ABV9YX24_9HYPH